MGKYGTEYTFDRLFMSYTGGYDWTVVAAYRRSDGAFAVVSDGGCSCNGYEEEEVLENTDWFYDKAEMYRRFDRAIDRDYNLSDADKVEAKAEIRKAAI